MNPEKKGLFNKFKMLISVFSAGLVLALVLPQTLSAGQEQLQAVVSIAPQEYFVERIGGEHVDVLVLLPPGASPHSFEPRSSQMVRLGEAHVYFAIGVEYEKTLLPRLKSMHSELDIIHTDHGIQKISMAGHEHSQDCSHEHDNDKSGAYDHGHEAEDNGHKHDQEGLDPHVWLSPDLVMMQAYNIYEALVRARPEQKHIFQENLVDFLEEILVLDQEIKGILSHVDPGAKFMVFHPAWGYFARNYGLVQVPIEVEGKEPKAGDLQELIDTAKKEDIKIVFVSPQFSKKSAQTIADAIDGETVAIDPLDRNWKQNMLEVADKFSQALHGRH